MENMQWKAIIIAIVLLVIGVFFKGVVDFFTLVVTDFVDTVVRIIREGLSGRHGIEPVVRFCLTVIIIFGLIKIFRQPPGPGNY